MVNIANSSLWVLDIMWFCNFSWIISDFRTHFTVRTWRLWAAIPMPQLCTPTTGPLNHFKLDSCKPSGYNINYNWKEDPPIGQALSRRPFLRNHQNDWRLKWKIILPMVLRWATIYFFNSNEKNVSFSLMPWAWYPCQCALHLGSWTCARGYTSLVVQWLWLQLQFVATLVNCFIVAGQIERPML